MLRDVSDDILLAAFLNGLKEEIKVEVKLFVPLNVEEAMEGEKLGVRIHIQQI